MRSDGKPMRALRALEKTNPAEPLTEYGVYLVARRSLKGGEVFHGALATLVERGLAVRTGWVGGYEWYITEAGRLRLKGSPQAR